MGWNISPYEAARAKGSGDSERFERQHVLGRQIVRHRNRRVNR